jgi:hypothetical protein
MGHAVEFVAALAHLIQDLSKERTVDDIFVNADQNVLLRNR